MRRLQRAQARLAVAVSRAGPHAGGGDARLALMADPAVRHCYDEVLAQRARLVALGHPEAVAPHQRWTTVRRWANGVVALLLLFAVWVAIRSLGAA